MYKVLIPLPGYAYVPGTVTKHIAPADVERFLKLKFIEPAKEENKAAKADKK